jgi:hypothetical protein
LVAGDCRFKSGRQDFFVTTCKLLSSNDFCPLVYFLVFRPDVYSNGFESGPVGMADLGEIQILCLAGVYFYSAFGMLDGK